MENNKSKNSQNDNGKIPTTFLGRLFSVPTRPAWIGFILGFGLYIIVGEEATNAMGFIVGLSVCLSGWLSIQRREYPLWTRMERGPMAVFYGWLALILGACLAIPALSKLLSR